jgi:hypothetical protein
MEVKKLAREYGKLPTLDRYYYESLCAPHINSAHMPRTLKALSEHCDTHRFERCADAINKDLREYGMCAIIKGNKFTLFYAGLERIYVSGSLQNPVAGFQKGAYALAEKVVRSFGVPTAEAAGKLLALEPLPNPVKWAIGDCIRGFIIDEVR